MATQLEIAAKLGVTDQTLRNWMVQGANIQDDFELARFILSKKGKPAPSARLWARTIIPENSNARKKKQAKPRDAINARRMEIENEVYTIAEIDLPVTERREKIINERLSREKLELELSQKSGKLVAIEDISEALTVAGSRIKARLQSFCTNLPPILEGQTAAKIKDILETKVDEVLLNIAEEFDTINIQ